MGNQSDLLGASKERFLKLGAYLDDELRKLREAGALTELDKLKLLEGAKMSAQEVIKALGRTDFPPVVQAEFVNRLIGLYQVEVEKILSEARERLYSIDRVKVRLDQITRSAFPDLQDLVQRRLITKQHAEEIDRKVNDANEEVLKGIASIPRNHPRRDELIDTWLEEQEAALKTLARQYLPRIGPDGGHSEQPEHRPNT